MGTFNLTPLASYQTKKVAIGFLLLGAIVKMINAINVIHLDTSFEQMVDWVCAMNLFIVNFSKIKNESSKVSLIRLTSIKAGGIFISGFLISISFVSLFFNEDIQIAPDFIVILFNAVIAASFLINLYFKKTISDEYSEVSVLENVKAYPQLYSWYILAFLAVVIVILTFKL